ncbi:tetratricopeptide repeat protein [Thalassotalea atypica]|uniref:tetratricopeptide repeat protein n=1 Tax=Thalassotalea atypica TaxID=2054316 RepID=UPI00257472F5|nr:tetratricopeptide repeat protein [Thalassotalea atypica]
MISASKISGLMMLVTLLMSANTLAQKMSQCDTSSCINYFKQYKKAAKRGHPQAVGMLGQMYYHGYGTDKNEKLALKYLKKASRYKDGAAQFKAGFIYLTSKSHKDIDEGVEYLEKAASNKFKGANFVLGMVHLDESYGRQDIKKADAYFAKSYKSKFEQIPEAIEFIDDTMTLDTNTFPKLYAQMQYKPLEKDKDGTMSWPEGDIEVITITSASLETTFNEQLVEFRKPIKSVGTRFLGKSCVERLTCINVDIADGTAFANMFLDGFTGKIVSGG